MPRCAAPSALHRYYPAGGRGADCSCRCRLSLAAMPVAVVAAAPVSNPAPAALPAIVSLQTGAGWVLRELGKGDAGEMLKVGGWAGRQRNHPGSGLHCYRAGPLECPCDAPARGFPTSPCTPAAMHRSLWRPACRTSAGRGCGTRWSASRRRRARACWTSTRRSCRRRARRQRARQQQWWRQQRAVRAPSARAQSARRGAMRDVESWLPMHVLPHEDRVISGRHENSS